VNVVAARILQARSYGPRYITPATLRETV